MSAKVKVWDPVVRVFHWGLALSFAIAWLSADLSKPIHHWAGYVAAALLAIRVVWGFTGTRYARFRQFVKRPRVVVGYLRDIAVEKERRFLGHNPAGGAMIVALILSVGSQVLTGWLQTTDAFFGVEWMETTHMLLSRLSLTLIVLHVMGVVVASLRHRENLPAAMVTGRKRRAVGSDVA